MTGLPVALNEVIKCFCDPACKMLSLGHGARVSLLTYLQGREILMVALVS